MGYKRMLNFLYITNHCPEYHEEKSQWAYYYCRWIKDRPEVRRFITRKEDIVNYEKLKNKWS